LLKNFGLFEIQVKSGFACEEDVKTIKSQIVGRVQQLLRERDVHRLSTARVTVSVTDSQPAVVTAGSQMPSVAISATATANRQYSQENDEHVDG